VAQAWEKVQSKQQGAEFSFRRPDASSLDEAITAQLEQEATTHNQPTVVAVDGKGQVQKEISPAAEAFNEQEQVFNLVMSGPDIQSAVVAPIKLQNQVIGTIQLHQTDHQRQWSDQDLALIQTVVDQVAQTAENLRLLDETRERAGREQTIREITDKLRASPDLGALLETAARELGQQLGVRHTVLELGIEAEEFQNGEN
jgi:GAF domain-containing protein